MKKIILVGSIAAGITFIYGCQQNPEDAKEHKGNETFDQQESNDSYNSGNTSLDTAGAATQTDNTTKQETETAKEQHGKVNNDPNGVNKQK